MRFLIIDDDNFKINYFLSATDKKDRITIKQSYNSGLKELIYNLDKYDCLILDMNFPHFDNESPETNLGLIVLEELERRNIKIPVAVYTSGVVDISKYNNVIDYIYFNGFNDIMNHIAAIKYRISHPQKLEETIYE